MVTVNRISKKELYGIVQHTLAYLDTHGIRTKADFERHLSIPPFDEREGIFLQIRHSNRGMAHTLSYIKQGRGIPLEIRFNEALSYTKIILKLDQVVEGYNPFMKDSFGNIIQERVILSSEIPLARPALEELAKNLE